MRVGLVLLCDVGKRGCTPLINTIISMGHTPTIIYWNDPNILTYIKSSNIQRWIFSGNATYKKDEDMTRVPMGVFDLPIKVFCICYSFQSTLLQLGYTLHHKRSRVYKSIDIPYKNTKLHVLLNYTQFIQSPVVGEVSSYHGESMIVQYKNAFMTQFHPEKTSDGRRLLKEFLDS